MKKKGAVKLVPFDATRYLGNEDAIAEYIAAALESGDTAFLLAALGDVARARGMSELSRTTGLGRESLYKAFSPGAQPRFDTVLRVANALGIRITAVPATPMAVTTA